MNKEERASFKVQGFGRVILAKRKIRQEKLIARALGKSTALLVRLCVRNWRRWVLDLKLDKCASAIQRRWRGLSGRRAFLAERTKRNKQERLIAMALGKSADKLVHIVFERWRDDYFFAKQSRAALVMQTRGRGFLGKKKMERRKKLEMQVKEMALLMAGNNTRRLQLKFLKLLFLGLQEKAAVKFQTVFRGKRGRNEFKTRRDRQRRAKALCRRCLADAGRLGMLGFKEFLAMTRKEKAAAAVKLQARYRIRVARRRAEFERKEKNRKEELIAMALGRNTDRLAKRLLQGWRELLEMKRGATLMQSLFRAKKSREEVEREREKRRKVELIIAMALGRHDLRLKKQTIYNMVQFGYYSRFAKKILYCYRAHIAKTIASRLKARREKRRRGFLIVFREFRSHMLGHGLKKWTEVVRATSAADVIQKFVREKLRRIRRVRVLLVSRAAGCAMVGLASVVTARRWVGGCVINSAAKGRVARNALLRMRMKREREGEVLCLMKESIRRRVLRACNDMWREMMKIWKVAYGRLQRGFRCALARRERLRRIEQERLLVKRCQVKTDQRLDRVKLACFRAFEELKFERAMKELYSAEPDLDGNKGVSANDNDDHDDDRDDDDRDDDDDASLPSSPSFQLPTISVSSHQAPLSSLIYIPLSGTLRGATHTLERHLDKSRENLLGMECDGESRGYYKARATVEKVGVFEWSDRDGITKGDRAALFKAAIAVIVKDCKAEDIEEITDILKGCWGSEGEIACTKKIVVIGEAERDSADADADAAGEVKVEWEGFFQQALKKESKITSLTVEDVKLGYEGAMALSRIFASFKKEGVALEPMAISSNQQEHVPPSSPAAKAKAVVVKVHVNAIQELVIKNCAVPPWGALPIFSSLSGNPAYRIVRFNASGNNVGGSAAVARAARDFVASQPCLVGIFLNDCNVGTRTIGGYQVDNVGRAIMEGVADWNFKVMESAERVELEEIKRGKFEDVSLDGNRGVGDCFMESVASTLEAMGEVGRRVGFDKVVRIGSLSVVGGSVTSGGAGKVSSAVMRLAAEGGAYGKESIIESLDVSWNQVTDEGARSLEEAVSTVEGFLANVDDNFVSDEMVREMARRGGEDVRAFGKLLLPNDTFARPSSEMYAGRGDEFKLPNINWGGGEAGRGAEGPYDNLRPVKDIRRALEMTDKVAGIKWWQINAPEDEDDVSCDDQGCDRDKNGGEDGRRSTLTVSRGGTSEGLRSPSSNDGRDGKANAGGWRKGERRHGRVARRELYNDYGRVPEWAKS